MNFLKYALYPVTLQKVNHARVDILAVGPDGAYVAGLVHPADFAHVGGHAARDQLRHARMHLLVAVRLDDQRGACDLREVFARGALQAAAYAVQAKPGLYDMEDVLFGGR